MKKIFLSGPYGNLTSLYTGIFASHPDIVGLNHGRHEIPEECHFFKGPWVSMQKLDAFVQYVCENSGSWNNHARENGTLDNLEQVGSFNTGSPKHIFWKEPGWMTGWLRSSGLTESLLDLDSDVCLVRPVRDPIRCIVTNSQNRHYFLYDDVIRGGNITETWERYFPWDRENDSPVFVSLEQLVNGGAQFLAEWWTADLMWHVKLAKKYPRQVFIHFENDSFSGLMENVGIGATEQWLASADEASQNIIRKPIHPDVHETFKDELKKSLLWHTDPISRKVVSQFLS